ncbi:PREDICTED: dynein assembly factor 3, axonemal homolog isoform X1 [Drosophila arizonae]|uniref:Dynein assembly factor 3, axonemal homolog isoform X1 n=1 Tax=Drosophila arizonae TaxID=7263 RepID=A0ABM1PF58_DROAR|nr:PREDICTED: dynein assembly factor 3, axonemal homolog isoform X1 [Drosophila arizonae]
MFWGLSSALDLYEEYLKAFKLKDEPEAEAAEQQPKALNILICGGADPRHVIKTLAKRYTHAGKPKLRIYMLDACVEIIARNMLLLGLALEPAESFSLVCKAHLFMDIYGNSLLRPSSHHYVAAKARTLLNMICDEEQLQRLAPMLNIESLKYKERDGLEMAFSYWQPQQQVYDIQRYWEQRVRALLGPRYDHREGAFDWDLSMTLKSREGQQICSQEYRYWRESGVAFVFPEYEHCKPNKTLAAGLVRNGRTFLHRGYVGDIQTGPFCGFGLRSSEERLHNSVHGDNDYRATDITERNLLEFFHELQTQTVYEHDKDISRRYGSTKLLMTPLLTHNECDANEGQLSYDKPWLPVPDVEVHFISPMEIRELQRGAPRWQNHFDVAFVAYNYYTFLSKEFFGALREQSLFVLETKLLTVERTEHIKKFEATAKELFKSAGLRPCINYQAINAKNMQLRYKKTPGGAGDDVDEFPEEPEEVKKDFDEMGDYETRKQIEEMQDERTVQSNEKEKTKLEEIQDEPQRKGLIIEEIIDKIQEVPKKEIEKNETETKRKIIELTKDHSMKGNAKQIDELKYRTEKLEEIQDEPHRKGLIIEEIIDKIQEIPRKEANEKETAIQEIKKGQQIELIIDNSLKEEYETEKLDVQYRVKEEGLLIREITNEATKLTVQGKDKQEPKELDSSQQSDGSEMEFHDALSGEPVDD